MYLLSCRAGRNGEGRGDDASENDKSLTGHGGRIDVATALYPEAPKPWIDLSTGISPLSWLLTDDVEVEAGPLPTGDALRQFEAAAAFHFGVDPTRVVALPGSEIGLRLLRFVGLPEPLLRIGPSYGTHDAVTSAMLSFREFGENNGVGTVLLANPNNPDGRLLTPGGIASIIGRRSRQGGWLVVDEAFADVDPAMSILPLLDESAPAIVFRSFGKFFGLAGLRLGFLVAPAKICTAYRSILGDWPVSAHAIAIGTAAYRDGKWIARTRVELTDRASRLDRLLERHGLIAEGSCPLFRLVDHPEAASIFDKLAHAGILTRAFDHTPTWLRFGLPADDAAFDRLDRALSSG